MIPASTKSSRRSSILKVPRSRSSLNHGGDANTSAVDDSPTVTTKIKRRVSFAEKKHVKEFCDSIEQGTVWDNTYEESDSSQMKTNQSDKFTEISQLSNTHGYQVQISANVETHSSITIGKKSVPKLVRQNAIDYESFPLEIVNSPNRIRQATILNNPDFLVNKENIPEVLKLSTAESSLVDDEEIVTCPRRSLSASPYPKFSVYCDDEIEKNNSEHLNCSNYENVSMDCTVIAGNSPPPECSNVDKHKSEYYKNDALCRDKDLEKTTKTMEKTQMFHDASMEITEAVPRARFSLKSSANNEEKTQFFQNASMEITEAIPSTKFLVKPNIDEEKTQMFYNKSMEITEAVPRARFSLKSSANNEEKTQFFHNASMEMTETIPNTRCSLKPCTVNEEKTQFFHNKSMEITQAVPNVKFIQKPSCVNDEKTQYFQNKSMEMTESLSNAVFLHKPNHLNDEKTTVFHNKSMEMTEAISSIKFPTGPNFFTQEIPQIFHDDSLEMTGIVPIAKCPLPKPNNIDDDRTTVFQNKSMEMTEVISNLKFPVNLRCTEEEKTQFFHNKSMEITQAVPCIKLPSRGGDSEEKTRVFHDQSMEMTEAITPLRHMNQNNSSNNALPTLTKHTPNISRSTNSTLHGDITHNYFMELTEAIQSIKRPYNSIESINKSLSELSSPIAKNPRYSNLSEQRKTISKEDLEKLHQLLRQDLSQINSLAQAELLQDNHCASTTNAISDKSTSDDNNDAMEMTEVIPSTQQAKEYMNGIENTDHVSFVEIPKPVEEVDSVHFTPVIQMNEPNELLNNRENLHVLEINDLSKENRSIAIRKSFQSINKSIAEQSEDFELTPSNPSGNNILEVPTLLKAFNKIVGETPITAKYSDISPEKGRLQNKCFNNEQTEDDITYDLTKPILKNKETEKTFLEFEEAPSFIYDQSLSEQYLKRKEENKLLNEPPMPELSFTEVFTSTDTNNLEKNKLTHVLSETETFNNNEKKDNIKEISCEIFDENKQEKMNKRATFVVEKHDNFTDIVRSTTYSEVESTERNIINQCDGDNELSDTVNKVNAVTNLDKEEHKKVGNEMNDREITKKQSICRPPIHINLLDADNESHVNDNQLISTNIVSTKRGRENVKDVLKKWKKHEDESVFLENDCIIKKIVQNVKEFADRRNKMKCMVKLGMNTINKTLNKEAVENLDESVIDTNDDKGPYEILEEGLRMYEKDDRCLWKIYDINPRVFCIEYYKTALLLLININVPDDGNEYEQITNVRLISRLHDEEVAILKIIDDLIIQRIDTQSLVKEYKTYEDIPKLIQYVTDEVKVIYDFYEDYQKLHRKYVIDILDHNTISLILRSQQMSNIIRLTIKLNFFTKIYPEDFKSTSLLGPDAQSQVEKLAKCSKPGSNFLSTYIKHVEQLLNVL